MKIKSFIYTLLGVAVTLFVIYSLILVIQALFGWGGVQWSDVTVPVLLVGIFFSLIVIGYYFGDDEPSDEEAFETTKGTNGAQSKQTFDPSEDVLEHALYVQKIDEFWLDNDGDKHEGVSHSAYLRFYPEGTVIATRSSHVPKKELENSFTYSGTFHKERDRVTFDLKKIHEDDDTISSSMTEEDHRQSKYYGVTITDDSLIKAGHYEGKVKSRVLRLGSHVFHKVPYSKMIITASEAECNLLDFKLLKLNSVIDTYQDTGFWYSNGETGPEWFTVHVEVIKEHKEAFEKALQDIFSEKGINASTYWS